MRVFLQVLVRRVSVSLCRRSTPAIFEHTANGRGYILLDVMGEVLHWGGQLVVSYVLVGLAYGWTLSSRAVQKYVPDDKVGGS